MIHKIVIGILVLIYSISCYSQDDFFEGYIKYDMKIIKLQNKSIEKDIQNYIGTYRTFIFQKGSYRYLGNSNTIEEDMFLSSDKQSYVKYRNNDTIYYADKNYNVLKTMTTEIIENADTINGIVCDLLILTTRHESSGKIIKASYYYNSDTLKIDPNWFNDIKYGNLNLIYSVMKSIPIKSILEFDFGTFESKAIEVKNGLDYKLENKILELIENKSLRPQRL